MIFIFYSTVQQIFWYCFYISQKDLENYLEIYSKRLMNERFDLLLSIMAVRAKINLPQVDISEYPEDMRAVLINLRDCF